MSNQFDIKGMVVEIFPTKVISDKFSTRQIVLKDDRERPNYFPIDFSGKYLNLVDDIKPNSDITVTCFPSGRRWEKDGRVSYFSGFTGVFVQQETAQAANNNTAQAANNNSPVAYSEAAKDDDMPF